MKEWVNTRIILMALLLGMLSAAEAQTDQDGSFDMQNQMQELQKQMEQMMKGFGDGSDANNFFFLDTLILNDLGNMPLDSMIQGLSFAFPGMEADSMLMEGFDLNGGMFGNGFQDQLNQMFKSLDDMGPDFFMDMEELQRQLEQNGIRPDDLDAEPRKPGEKKKKVYKI